MAVLGEIILSFLPMAGITAHAKITRKHSASFRQTRDRGISLTREEEINEISHCIRNDGIHWNKARAPGVISLYADIKPIGTEWRVRAPTIRRNQIADSY
ncbi:MAG TPA: hypothetical protein VFQ86_13090 [Arachidicoccus soli]|nr:hypothetical protein [Arachidicoccus soli]